MTIPETSELLEPPKSLSQEIDDAYESIFSSEERFNTYFFSTPDRTTRDAQVRLGVFIKRLIDEPSERFWLMRRIYRGPGSSLSNTSIHRLSTTGFWGTAFALNGCMQEQIQIWKEEQPDDIEQFIEMIEERYRTKLRLPPPENEELKTVYIYPKIVLSRKAVIDVLDATLPEDYYIEYEDLSNDEKHFDVKSSVINFNIHVWNHSVFGDYIGVNFPDYAVPITDEILREVEVYKEKIVLPTLLYNAIEYLTPTRVFSRVEEEINKPELFERMFMTPGAHHQLKHKSEQYFAWGRGIDLGFKFAQEFGFLSKKLRWTDHTFLQGWFTTTEELWHALFNSDYPGSVQVRSVDDSSTAIQVASNKMSATHQRVIEYLGDDESDLVSFTKNAKEVVEGYRMFTTEDIEIFMFPDGYQPIAVSRDGQYAIGFREVEKGIELCFQLPTETIISQINEMQEGKRGKIRQIQNDIELLEETKKKYLSG